MAATTALLLVGIPAVGADTWSRGRGSTVVSVDAAFTVDVAVDEGWRLENGGVSPICSRYCFALLQH